jgi:hypothetical protein
VSASTLVWGLPAWQFALLVTSAVLLFLAYRVFIGTARYLTLIVLFALWAVSYLDNPLPVVLPGWIGIGFAAVAFITIVEIILWIGAIQRSRHRRF